MVVDPVSQVLSLLNAARGTGATDANIAAQQQRIDAALARFDGVLARLEKLEAAHGESRRQAKETYHYFRQRMSALEEDMDDVKGAVEKSLGPHSPSASSP